MGNNLSQEIYKFTHQRTSLYGLLIMIALMLYSSIPAYKVNPFLITQGFGGYSMVCDYYGCCQC